VAKKHYTLTLTAEDDFRRAKQWSSARWGKELTRHYFKDLHEAAEHIAQNQKTISPKSYLTHIDGLEIAVVREHYLIYVPVKRNHIIIVAHLRQTQDVLTILEANSFIIQREVKDALKSIK